MCEGVSEYCVGDNVIMVRNTLLLLVKFGEFISCVSSIHDNERNNGWKLTQE